MPVHGLHSLEYDIGPLLRTEGIRLSLHEFLKQANRAGFQAHEHHGIALVRMSRGLMLVDAHPYRYRREFFDERRIDGGRSNSPMSQPDVPYAVDCGHRIEQALQGGDAALE